MTDFVTVTGRLGALRWLELRCFEIIGGWTADTAATDGELRVLWNAQSAHHAWRADLVGSRLSIARELPADAATTGSIGAQALVSTLTTAAAEGPSRLVIVARDLLPRLVSAYRSLALTTTPASDEPVARIARIGLADVLEDWQRAQELLEKGRGETIFPA
jgi:hypothetical protein